MVAFICMSRKIIRELHEKHIQGTKAKAIVVNKKVFLCHLTNAVTKGLALPTGKVYINTRVIKHLFDKKPAEEFDFLVENIHKIVKYPDLIYDNKQGKRGEYCFVKSIKSEKYFCCLELLEVLTEDEVQKEIAVATAFRIRKESYLNGYELLWSWKDGEPSS